MLGIFQLALQFLDTLSVRSNGHRAQKSPGAPSVHFWISNPAQAISELKLSRALSIRPGIPLIDWGN